MVKKVSILYFIIIAGFTISISLAQNPKIHLPVSASDDVVNAVQDQRIRQIETNVAVLQGKEENLAAGVSDLAASMNRFTGIGIGIGATLTILQALQLLMQSRRRKGDSL